MSKDKTARIISIIVFVLAVPCLVFLIFKRYIFADNIIGIFVQVFAAGLMVWARITFGFRSFHAAANPSKGELVTSGPYSLLRHPIYDSIIYFAWAGVLSHRSPDAFAAAIFLSLFLITRMLIEEKFLMAAYDEYKTYCKRTYRLIPFLF